MGSLRIQFGVHVEQRQRSDSLKTRLKVMSRFYLICVEKQFGYSFKVQVLAVIYLNTQLKVHVDLVHIIFPQTEFSNTFHKYRSIKHSSKQSNKVAHKIYSI